MLYDRAWYVQHPLQDLSKTDRSIGRGTDTQSESPKVRGIAGHIEQAERGAIRKFPQAQALYPLLPTAMVFVSYGFVLVQVQVLLAFRRAVAAGPPFLLAYRRVVAAWPPPLLWGTLAYRTRTRTRTRTNKKKGSNRK